MVHASFWQSRITKCLPSGNLEWQSYKYDHPVAQGNGAVAWTHLCQYLYFCVFISGSGIALCHWGLSTTLSGGYFCCCSVAKSRPILLPYGLQHTRLPCPPPSPGVCLISCPLNQWCQPTISSSVTLFSFCLQSLPALGSFPMSRLFASGGQSIGASASVLPMSISVVTTL